MFLACSWVCLSLICYVSGIAASNYSHVCYFPSRAMYDEFYTIVLRVVDIAFEDFASLVQTLLVEHIRKTMSADAATWYKEWWTGAKGRYCLCHATHGGTNNNMGVEVDWRDIKKLCPPSCTLATFIGSLCHFIQCLGTEHEEHLIKCETPNAFIEHPVIHESIWDEMQDLHPKTLACSFVLAGNGKNLEKEFTDRAIEIYDLCDESTALHLKIEAWHQNNKLSKTSPGYPRSEDVKSILIPRQHLLKTLDPVFTRTVQEALNELRPMRTAYNVSCYNDLVLHG